MDPDANWEEQREIRARIRNKETLEGDYTRLRELKEALAGWLARGGFPPKKMRAR